MGIHIRFEDSNLSPFNYNPTSPVSLLQRVLLVDGTKQLSHASAQWMTIAAASFFIAASLALLSAHWFPIGHLNIFAALAFCTSSIFLGLMADVKHWTQGMILLATAVLGTTLSVIGLESPELIPLTFVLFGLLGIVFHWIIDIDLIKDRRVMVSWATFMLTTAALI